MESGFSKSGMDSTAGFLAAAGICPGLPAAAQQWELIGASLYPVSSESDEEVAELAAEKHGAEQSVDELMCGDAGQAASAHERKHASTGAAEPHAATMPASRATLETLAATPVDKTAHAEWFGRIVRAANRLDHPAAGSAEQWQVLGFQSSCMHTDFRGGGLLALRVLVHHLEEHADDAGQMLRLGCNRADYGARLPLATTSINITSMLAELLLRKPDTEDNGQRRETDHLAGLIEELGPVEAFGRFHAAALRVFLVFWHASEASLLDGDFDAVLAALRKSVCQLLASASSGGPSGLELAAWSQALFTKYRNSTALRHRYKGALVRRAAGDTASRRPGGGRGGGLRNRLGNGLQKRASSFGDKLTPVLMIVRDAEPSPPAVAALTVETDPDLTAEDRAMLAHQRTAQLAHARRSAAAAVSAGLDYRGWLQKDFAGDYENEFAATPTHRRKNELWHTLWDQAAAAGGAGDEQQQRQAHAQQQQRGGSDPAEAEAPAPPAAAAPAAAPRAAEAEAATTARPPPPPPAAAIRIIETSSLAPSLFSKLRHPKRAAAAAARQLGHATPGEVWSGLSDPTPPLARPAGGRVVPGPRGLGAAGGGGGSAAAARHQQGEPSCKEPRLDLGKRLESEPTTPPVSPRTAAAAAAAAASSEVDDGECPSMLRRLSRSPPRPAGETGAATVAEQIEESLKQLGNNLHEDWFGRCEPRTPEELTVSPAAAISSDAAAKLAAALRTQPALLAAAAAAVSQRDAEEQADDEDDYTLIDFDGSPRAAAMISW